MKITAVHHIAIIASDYERSKTFYTEIVGLTFLEEFYRAERDSWMGKLGIGDDYIVELFSFPGSPDRPPGREPVGLRHLAFALSDVPAARRELIDKGIECEELRTDPNTGKAMFFFRDPDGMVLEVYEAP